jgi:2-C-methyl-D-erythritol 2,4-cyclodiphosphate synthase
MYRIGIGYDIHKLIEGRDLIIGGVKITHEMGLLGHSDADVLIHALIDAMLGALALDDIGTLFPDTDPQFKGADSMVLMAEVYRNIKAKGYCVVNVDATIIAQRPKMRSYIDTMRANIAETLECDIDCINVKATTEEGMGFTGEGMGISAHAVCLID